MQRVHLNNAVQPHTWQECWPVVVDLNTGKLDPHDDINKAIRRIVRNLGQLDRIKWHQACCQNRDSPAHMATVNKIHQKLKDEGFID